MSSLLELTPHVRSAHRWVYDGGIHEHTRTGYAFAIHYFTAGMGSVHIEGTEHKAEKGSMIFVRPGQVHSFHPLPKQPLEAYNVYFDLWSVPRPHQPRFAFAPDESDPKYMTPVEECPELDHIPACTVMGASSLPADCLHQLCQMEYIVYGEEIASSLLRAVLLHAAGSPFNRKVRDYRITRLMQQIELYPDAEFQVELWCKQTGLQKSQLYKLFREEAGMSPMAYQSKMRLKKAALLLLESTQTVTAIAELLGYSSIHHFSKQFSFEYGKSPTEYRQMNRMDTGQGESKFTSKSEQDTVPRLE
ncbi:helix-turn-helix domain-containing protein [Paenibacillus sp. HJL G12]|uniref:Helix-turn-helix domain-containing protein n=1 Tax=Paenibacillus dendrobii TaxID=2691084 RepID=A0A7X3IID2_9BACL|nr:AraC family transcriptional regulator [Paenibacillus dendrobii]MWV44275.1 helix-turn-helix domain-containing protein [Paenibacillus dendrobii]